MNTATWILIIIIIIAVLVIITMNSIANQLIFVPPKHSKAKKQKVEYIGANKQVPVVEYLPDTSGSDQKQAVLYSHGNATDIRELHAFFQTLASALSTTVYAYEYPGYSYLKHREVSGVGCIQHLEATLQWLIQTKQFKPANITLIGRSLGTGPTVQVAKRHPELASVILISPYKSMPRIIYDSVLTDLLLPAANMFPNYEDINQVKSPITFVHGKQDTLIGAYHSEDMLRRRQGSKDPVFTHDQLKLLDNEGHNIGAGKSIQLIRSLLGRSGKRPAPEDEARSEADYEKLARVDRFYAHPLYKETGLANIIPLK